MRSEFKLAQQECANLNPDNSCLGVMVAGLTDYSIPVVPLKVCAVKRGERCAYFINLVIPLASIPGRFNSSRRGA